MTPSPCRLRRVFGLALVLACGPTSPPPATAAPPRAAGTRPIALPGAPADGWVAMDYLAYDRARRRVWVPAGNTGSVDVIEAGTDRVTRLEGFATREMDRHGKKRLVGPSAVSVGDREVYVGNRGDTSVCALDAATLARKGCVTLPSMPDGVVYVPPLAQVWVTLPGEHAIATVDVRDPAHLTVAGTIKLDGEPEGYAVDPAGRAFYTNLEDKDRTVAIDLASRAVVATWPSGCGEAGGRGLAIAPADHLLLLACPDRVQVLDLAHDGKIVARLDTGEGLDNLDYVPARREVYAAAAKPATLTVARLGRDGSLTAVARRPTAAGARNAVATDEGVAYVTDSPAGAILVVTP